MKKSLSLKRCAAFLLAACMVLSLLAGCGGGGGEKEPSNSTPSTGNPDASGGAPAGKDSLTVALTDEPDYLSTCDHDSLMGCLLYTSDAADDN